MQKGIEATLDDVILACVLGEADYPVRRMGENAPVDRETILAMSPAERRDLVNTDWNRELVSDDVSFFHAEISVADLDDCYYRDSAPWTAFTGASHLVRDGAHELDALDDFTRARVEWALETDGPFPELVFFSPSEDGPRVLVHGAARATAHVRRYSPTRMLDAFWGISEDVVKWPWWPSTDG